MRYMKNIVYEVELQHIVFAPKYRKQIFYGEKKRATGKIVRKLCKWKGLLIIEADGCPDHIYTWRTTTKDKRIKFC